MHQYCAGGINAVVEPAFKKMEAKLNTIKSLNDAYDGKQLTFFSLEDTSVFGVDRPELSSSLLEAVAALALTLTLTLTLTPTPTLTPTLTLTLTLTDRTDARRVCTGRGPLSRT